MPATRSDTGTLRALLALQRDLALEVDLERILDRIARAACEILQAERATIYVLDEERDEVWAKVATGSDVQEIRLPLDGRGLAVHVARTGETLSIADPYSDTRFNPDVDARSGYRTRNMLVLPIASRDGTRTGVLQVMNRLQGTFDANDEELAHALAASAGIAFEHAELHGELREERLRSVRIAEETRHRLAATLHDGVAQALANAAINLELVARRAPEDLPGALDELESLRQRLLASQQELRDILFSLRPVVLESAGLGEATRVLAKRLTTLGGARVFARRIAMSKRLRPEVEAGAFLIIQEATNNAVKHGAKNVTLDVYEEGDETVARIEDDGGGFDVDDVLSTYALRGSLGLLQLRETARMIGAQLVLDSNPGHGTRVHLRIRPDGGHIPG
jgi:signal transduction histidine kinase